MVTFLCHMTGAFQKKNQLSGSISHDKKDNNEQDKEAECSDTEK